MIPKNYTSEGIVLARKNYSEADRILIVFSEKYGKLSLLAKGVRRLKSRKRAHVEIFNRINFSATSGKGLDIITEAEVIDTFSDIKNNLKKVTVAYFFAEVTGRMIREGESHPEVYRNLRLFLEKLRTKELLKSVRKEYIFIILVSLGFWPQDKNLSDPDRVLDEILERPQSSARVGKRLLM
ncbi:DNA repair protein RecO [Candidatus Woesebacteria bacterium RBG_13_36_22]|uniref:DNA repair protein RecO n=1 Tax=Candidatus Woesebacteria bacterium RBG_13_36_22 TaxID=1802478 RepID=A0A1F7X631_9BACT|nr:MAG: DNA repair protein RecO [Candidatus Woesebacteria bacterium RBG_13_36_22]